MFQRTMATSFFRPSAATFCGVYILLHLLYFYNGVYPRLYETPLGKRDGLWCGYFLRDPRSFGQFLSWLGIIFCVVFIWDNYGCSGEMLDVSYAMLTAYFITEILFLYRMTGAKESRDYNFCRSVKIFGVLFCLFSGVFYGYSDGAQIEYGIFFIFFCGRSLLYDGYLYSLGGCSGYHQIAKSAINQKGLYTYAEDDGGFNEPPPPGSATRPLVGSV